MKTDRDIINLARYPLDDLDSEQGVRFIEQVRAELAGDGSCTLPGFVVPEILVRMAAEAESLEPVAYAGPTEVTPYYFNYRLGEGMDLDDAHPLKHRGQRNLRQVAADLIPENHLLSILFHGQLMPEFLGRVQGQTIYRNQDRYQSLNINLQDEGGCQQWHFDTAHMVTTLLLQAPEAGGVFEYCPNIRSDENENFDDVRNVLDGRSDRVRKLHLEAGMLSLFKGHYSMHRVTPVRGSIRRIQAILGYTSIPNLTGSVESSILHYGPRVAEIEGKPRDC